MGAGKGLGRRTRSGPFKPTLAFGSFTALLQKWQEFVYQTHTDGLSLVEYYNTSITTSQPYVAVGDIASELLQDLIIIGPIGLPPGVKPKHLRIEYVGRPDEYALVLNDNSGVKQTVWEFRIPASEFLGISGNGAIMADSSTYSASAKLPLCETMIFEVGDALNRLLVSA
jgi:hypothetical protein